MCAHGPVLAQLAAGRRNRTCSALYRRSNNSIRHLRHSHSLSNLSMDEEVKQRPEDQCDVPTPNETLDQAEQERLPGQQLEAGKKDRECCVIDRQAGKDQIADDADNVRKSQRTHSGSFQTKVLEWFASQATTMVRRPCYALMCRRQS